MAGAEAGPHRQAVTAASKFGRAPRRGGEARAPTLASHSCTYRKVGFMSSNRLKYSLLAVLLMLPVSVGVAAVATAATASSSQSKNAATLTLSVKTKRSFARQHVTVRAQRPATRRKSSYALPTS